MRLTDAHGMTPLHAAATWNVQEAAKLLLAAKAPVNAKDEKGNTPLHATLEFAGADSPGSVAVAKMLLAAGADASAKNAAGQTPLELARAKGATAMLEVLGGTH